MTPSRSSLRAIIERCGVRLTEAQYDRLWAYHGMLRAANAELNLTRIHNFENMVLKHYVDSLLVLRFTELPSPLVDMGSGAGLPGIPLKIARPDVSMILAEPRGARAEFLERTCERLGLEGVEVFAGKVGPKFPHRVAGVVSRAVATIPETLERVAACIEPGGKMIFMKGPDCLDEIEEAGRSHSAWFSLSRNQAYEIPGTPHARRLVVFERSDAAPPSLDVASESEPSYAGPIREVASESNPTFRHYRELLTGRGIRKRGAALFAGSRIVAEVTARFPDRVTAWVTDSKGPAPPVELGSTTPWHRLSDALFAELDVAGTHAPLASVTVPPMAVWSDDAPWPPGCTLFVPFQDPENVGAVIRSAAAFGVARVVLLREAAHPFHPKSARAAGPALLQVSMELGPSIRDLVSSRAPLIALSADGEDLRTHPFPARYGLVPGLEGPGLPEHLRLGMRRRIPIENAVESLNAGTAVAIALYEGSRTGVTTEDTE
jgi:16S rRNA (guanine(527)-N(7))-methyltransferase RsmG